jgi:multidrug efflux pump subunit AcrA (membrane-fusion protein)
VAGHRALVISAIAVALAGAGVWLVVERPEPVKASRGGGGGAVPVTVGEVSKRDMPIYLTGLGAVQASFTVGIRAQVDGKLEQVLFKEGEHVRKGDVLAKIDPRLYEAALDNAKAQKARDEAQLISARKDLERSRTLVNQFFETKQVVDQQQAKVDQVIAMVDVDRAAIETAQTNLAYISIGQQNRRTLGKGTLLLIDNMVDQASATMRMKAMFGNEDEQLWPEDFVNARVSLKVLRDALTVPSAPIQTGPDGMFAWVVATGDRTTVTSGLAEGERVATRGRYKLRLGSRVTVSPPAAPAVAQRNGSS